MERNEFIGSQIKKMRKALKMNQLDFAQDLGISRGYLSRIEAYGVNFKLPFILNISVTYNVSLDWLCFGKGQMFLESKNISQSESQSQSESECEAKYESLSTAYELLKSEKDLLLDIVLRLKKE